jgi:hypothetical protein
MTGLYRDALPDVSSDFVFDDEVLKAALKRIYSEDFNPMTQIEENLFNEFWDKLNEATDKGFGTVTPVDHDYEFYQELQYNNAVFAAFKTHRLQNDVAAKLLDENGELKPFEQWLNDVQTIADHQCRTWFKTEYDTAIKRAHIAAEWKQFEQEADILPNLEWIKSTSITPGEDHKIYWGVIRPMVDNFWNEHKPGDRWGCNCGLRSTDKKPTPMPDIPKESNPDEPAPGLNNNPGTDGILFSDTHPYYPPNCAACNLPGKKVLSNNPSNRLVSFFNIGAKGRKDCYHCSRPAELLKKAGVATKEKKRRAKTISFVRAKNNAIQKIKKYINKSIPATNLQTDNLWNSKWGIKAILNHSISNDEIKAAMALPKNIDKLKFIESSPLGEGKDLNNPVDAKNVAEKRRRGITHFNLYEYSYKGKTYYVKLAKNRKHGGFEELYTFTAKP